MTPFLADGKVRDDHPAGPKIQIEILGAINLHRRFLHVAMRRIEIPRAALVALSEADPDLSHTLRRETLPPTAHRPVSLDVFVLTQAIPGVEARPGEQLRKIDAVASGPFPTARPSPAACRVFWTPICGARRFFSRFLTLLPTTRLLPGRCHCLFCDFNFLFFYCAIVLL